jgi:hypothetical protein
MAHRLLFHLRVRLFAAPEARFLGLVGDGRGGRIRKSQDKNG